MKCLYCDKELKDFKSIYNHIVRVHRKTVKKNEDKNKI